MHPPVQRSSLVASALSLLILFAAAPLAAQQPAFDSATLIGEWNGTWDVPSGSPGGRGTGTQFLTITKIDGDKVVGEVRSEGV